MALRSNHPNSSPDRIALTMQQLRDQLRPGQQRMADWEGGPLAVSAVPGAGKSTGMAIAAALAIAKRMRTPSPDTGVNIHTRLQSPITATLSRELMVVTFTRSATANLKLKIRAALQTLDLPPLGFSVYTLHGLALHIAQRHPEQSGLNLNQMTLMTPTQRHRLVRSAVERWITAHPHTYEQLIQGKFFDGEETERLRRQSVLRTEVLPQLAITAIHEAKSSGLTPEQLLELSHTHLSLQRHPDGNTPASEANAAYLDDLGQEVLAIATGLYGEYQRVQQQRHTIDYDDMIVAALRVLENDQIRHWWQTHIFAVFEDEAQDSSPLQTRLLDCLAQDPSPQPPIDAQANRHLIRVGDPNQAINATFTPADPIFFRQFCLDCARQGQLAEMTQAGRSCDIIMAAANRLMDWVNHRYPHYDPRPFRPQHITPVAADDPQPDANPAPLGQGLELHRPQTTVHTVALMAERIGQLVAELPTGRIAILVRENRQGQFVADCLRSPQAYNIAVNVEDLGLTIYDVGDRDRHSAIPAEMLAMLRFLSRPHSTAYLKAALKVLMTRQLIPSQDLNTLAPAPEIFLYPGPLDEAVSDAVDQTRRYCAQLLKARLELPAPQLIPFLAFSLQYDQTELATADKLSDRLRRETAFDPSLAALLDALTELTASETFGPVETEQADVQYTQPGQITIITMHRAKGLDWDSVFLPFLHERTIPGRSWTPPQMQFLGPMSLSAMAKAQIRHLLKAAPLQPPSSESDPPASALQPTTIQALWTQAQHQKVAEEYRLLYVAMTRAKRLLWMAAAQDAPFSWQKPDTLSSSNPCPALIDLMQRFPTAP